MAIQILPTLHAPGSSTEKDPIVGIDLGTTHSLVAVVEGGVPRVLPTREGRNLLPSVVTFPEEGVSDAPRIGYGAKANKRRGDARTVFSVKRLLGKSLTEVPEGFPLQVKDAQGQLGLEVGGRTHSAIEVSALILRELRAAAEKALGCKVTRAVVTVPAYFNDSQRQATRTAGRLAGLDVLRIINEPTAAALAYGWDRTREGTIAVYDLGGGTFDVSILRIQGGVFEVLATHGDTALGGDDIDQALLTHFAPRIDACFGQAWVPELAARALEAAEALKIELSQKPQAQVALEFDGKTLGLSMDRAELAALIEPLLARTRASCLQALQDAGLTPSELSDVVLVGGPTRLSVVQDYVRGIFDRAPGASMHPEEVVAVGAAVQADILAGNNKDLLLLDVVPLSLGIETYGGLMTPLIPRNSRIPAVAKEAFTTFVDRQTGVDIHVLQGERERVAENRSLARFTLKGIKPQAAGTPRIEVSFMIDADGILQVSAKDLVNGGFQAVEVRPSSGLTDEAVERMLQDGLDHEGDDAQFKDLVEARNKAEPTLRAAELRLGDAERLLAGDDHERIIRSVQGLRRAMDATDPKAIQTASAEVNQATLRLAELLVKEAIESASKK